MKIKVLAISHLFPNAEAREYGVFVFNRLQAVNRLCHVKVISPVQWFPFMGWMGRGFGSRLAIREKWRGIDVQRPRFPVIPRYLKILDAFSFLASAFPAALRLRNRESFDYDIVDVHWTYPDLLTGFVLARLLKKKLIVTIRGREALYLGELTLRRKLLEYLLRQADFVITLSAELQDLVVDLGVPPEKVRVILNGVDIDQFRYRDQETCRRNLGLAQEGKIMVSVGSLIERKGHHELIRIMSELTRLHPVALYIIGGINPEGDFSPALRRMIQELGLNNVHMID
ncbi:glycosyltransferase, partial [Desulfuromonas sp. TF]|uniref:glycosyltransferase n=1 Tax=Desulfuromonas sp. TF TaxID=1232410 RepID=UPI0018726B9E